ncbi:Gfo/Idh/MocA family oxidoreductase [Microbacterium betulae]|uniref:Gfo/Idh/MocA family oxidoreductase n=1 Tax=Microbacterium betulae TaxID=2981139 RepID=A0AA97I6D8_9MICO|nr:Gfo/Idh/MocA family oxidoreductase [Microbacterium sp. AB]WOF22517.1 Gfo/Idh/MocA family oxidoreductase [Microbacterium sp. AB]
MGRPHGIGIVGLGNISRQYLDALGDHPAVRIAAVSDLSDDRARAVADETGARAVTVDELVRHPDVQTVLNLTIPAAHAEIALAAIRAGRAVYGEKPLALSVESGREIVDAAARAGVSVGSAPDTVLGTGVQTARRAVDDGLIGRPLAASATMVTAGHERWHPSPDFYYLPGGGPLLDMGPYYVSALVTLLGPVVAVSGAASRLRPERVIGSGPRAGETIRVEVDTHVSGILEHANGALSTIVTSFDGTATTASPLEVHGADGTLLVPDPNRFDGDVVLRGADGTERVLPVSGGYEDGARGVGLLDFIRTTPGAEPRAGGAMALHVLDIMTGVLRAAEEGRRVVLTTSTDRPEAVPFAGRERWRS